MPIPTPSPTGSPFTLMDILAPAMRGDTQQGIDRMFVQGGPDIEQILAAGVSPGLFDEGNQSAFAGTPSPNPPGGSIWEHPAVQDELMRRSLFQNLGRGTSGLADMLQSIFGGGR